ncbi:unnamed protein product [Mortierella alpina]
MKTSSLVSLATAVLFAAMYTSAAPTPSPASPPRVQDESNGPLSARSTDPPAYTPASARFSPPQDICQPGRQEQTSAVCNRNNYKYPQTQQAPNNNMNNNSNNNYNSYNGGDGNYRSNSHDREGESAESMDSHSTRGGERAESVGSTSSSHPQDEKLRRRNQQIGRRSFVRPNTADGRIVRTVLRRRRYVSRSSGIGSMYAKDGTQGR